MVARRKSDRQAQLEAPHVRALHLRRMKWILLQVYGAGCFRSCVAFRWLVSASVTSGRVIPLGSKISCSINTDGRVRRRVALTVASRGQFDSLGASSSGSQLASCDCVARIRSGGHTQSSEPSTAVSRQQWTCDLGSLSQQCACKRPSVGSRSKRARSHCESWL